GVRHFALIKGLRPDSVLRGLKDPVAAVLAATHDPVGDDCGIGAGAVAVADDDAPAGVGVGGEQLHQVLSFHVVFPFSTSSRATCSAAAGSSFHSACSITRRCRVSGVSPGRMSTAFWAMILPPSGIALT